MAIAQLAIGGGGGGGGEGTKNINENLSRQPDRAPIEMA